MALDLSCGLSKELKGRGVRGVGVDVNVAPFAGALQIFPHFDKKRGSSLKFLHPPVKCYITTYQMNPRTEPILFSYKKNVPADSPSAQSTRGTPTEFVASYKYLGNLSNENLSPCSKLGVSL